jgi:uncharacterized protein YciI
MKYVMTYECVSDFDSFADEHFQAHLSYLKGFHERGVLLLMGPMQEPFNGDALAVFSSQEAAEEFVAGDPFVLNGVVKSYTIRPWQEVLQPEPEAAA